MCRAANYDKKALFAAICGIIAGDLLGSIDNAQD
jgi:hypothetical protein